MKFDQFRNRYQKAPVEEYPNRVLEAVPEPMVSVKISTYQHADFIRDCLDGALMQETDFPIEILIGEDESSDGTREICKAYADRHPDKIRLFLHRRENNIAIHGRPTGRFQTTYTRFMCRGKYIALCEGDDYWTDPLKLQKQVEFLEGHPQCVLVSHDWVPRYPKDPTDEEQLIALARERGTINDRPLTLTLVHRRVLKQVPEAAMEVVNGDTFFQHLLRLHGTFHKVDGIEPAVYRQHDESLWSSQSRCDQALTGIKSLLKMWPVFLDTEVEYLISGGITHWLQEIFRSWRRTGNAGQHLFAIGRALLMIKRHRLLFETVVGPLLMYPARAYLGQVKKRLVT